MKAELNAGMKKIRVTVPMTRWMEAAIEDFRKTYGYRSTGSALRKLIERGLVGTERRA